MYAILSDGVLLALCDKPRYVKKNDDGIYVESAKEEAIALSINGDLYNIRGENHIPDAPQVVVKDDDVSEYVFRNRMKIEEDAKTFGAAFVASENAICEMDAGYDERVSAIEVALCELDELMSGGGEEQ